MYWMRTDSIDNPTGGALRVSGENSLASAVAGVSSEKTRGDRSRCLPQRYCEYSAALRCGEWARSRR